MNNRKSSSRYEVGKIFITNEGCEIEIIEKIDGIRRTIEFKDEYRYKVECLTSNINAGKVSNPYYKSVCKVGYIGIGEYKANVNLKATKEYQAWYSMIGRCYDKKRQEKHPSYIGTIVCDEWHNFQNFAKWHNNNYPNIDGIKFHLDKDLLQCNIENKIYSPKTCVFLPDRINMFLANKKSNNISGYTGVYWHKAGKKWVAQCSAFEDSRSKYLGIYNTQEEAINAYKEFKLIQDEKSKDYLRSLNYLPEEIIQLIKTV